MVNGGDCAPITDYFSYANRQFNVNLDYTFGSEMVSNGDFAQLEEEKVVNGSNDNPGTDWNVNSNWDNTVAGKFSCDGTSSADINQHPDIGPLAEIGKTYLLSFEILSISSGNLMMRFGGVFGDERTTVGVHSQKITATSTDRVRVRPNISGTIASVTNISVKEVIGDGAGWNYGSNWLHSGSIAYSNGNNSNGLEEAMLTTTSGSTYIVTYDIGALTQGEYQVSIGGTLGTERTAIGTYTETITASTNSSLKIMANNNAIGAVDNISVIELTNIASETNDVYSSCDECTLGCTDVLAWNFDSTSVSDDGSCLYASNCANPIPTNLGVNWTTDTKASINWNDMNDGGDCRVIKYFTRYRTGGSNAWSVKSAGVGSGLCNIGLSVTDKTLQNLASGEIYEFQMKAFYCGGGVSGWSNSSYFSTQSDCPEITNLTVETFNSNHSKARFTWDTTGAYVFARIALRVDTAGSSWQTAGGFGVYYPALSVNKFGLTSGQTYRSQGRTFCDANITSYRSDWTSPIFWTQPGVLPSKIDGGSALIENFKVYPNPSSDIFNISFVSEEVQNLKIRVVNMLGEVVSRENLERFVGEYTKQINLEENTKGVYFLEIITNQGVVNKKIVLQ
jgi:hypothetical protein